MIGNMSNTINLILSLVALPADFIMLRYLFHEKIAHNGQRATRKLLILLFVTVMVASFVNAVDYLLVFFSSAPHVIHYTRSLIVNTGLTSLAWMFVFFIRKYVEE